MAAELRAEVQGMVAELRAEVQGMAAELRAEMQDVRLESRDLRSEVHGHVNRATAASTGVLLAAMGVLAAVA